MYSGQFAFTQLMEHLPWHILRRCVARYDGDRKIKIVYHGTNVFVSGASISVVRDDATCFAARPISSIARTRTPSSDYGARCTNT